jgi:hypothetical protein
MNTANLILSQNTAFKFITVRFKEEQRSDRVPNLNQEGSKSYTYKTTLELVADDFVVVESPSGFKVVRVESVLDISEVDNKYEYKWVVSKVDLEYYEKCKLAESSVKKQVNKLEFEKTRRAFQEELEGRLGKDAVITLQGIARL